MANKVFGQLISAHFTNHLENNTHLENNKHLENNTNLENKKHL